jgi:tetratricopeptide (TPR) repeat protein
MTRRAGFDVNLLVRIARLQIAAGDPAGAEYSLQKAVLQQDGHMPAQALLAELEIATGRYAAAEARIQRVLGNPATQATGQRLQADLYMRQRRYDQAVAAYRAALTRTDTLENALGLYRAWQASGKPQEAARHMETWSRAHPADPVARRVLAEAYLAAGRHAEARRAYEQILAGNPNDPVALNNLANILLQTGNAGALAMAERAYRAAPQDADAADTLGLVLLRTQQPERALKYLREARLRAPKNPAIRDHLADALEASGRAEAAREERMAAQSLRVRR